MSKYKIGKINRKRIVAGDKNLVNPESEVHVEDLTTSSEGGGSSVKYPTKYYAVDWDKVDSNLKSMIIPAHEKGVLDDGTEVVYLQNESSSTFGISTLVKLKALDSITITTSTWTMNTSENDLSKDNVFAFSYNPIKVGDITIYDLPTLIEMINSMGIISTSLDGITEITEEEFYNLN